MISTIFYFVDTLSFDSYIEKLESGDISMKTVVFVKDTRSIYMGGLQYGNMTASDFKTILSVVVRQGDTEVNQIVDRLLDAINRTQESFQNTVTQLNTSIANVSTVANNQTDRLNTLVNNLDGQVASLVEENIQDLHLPTTYAKADEVGAILEWLYSGLKASTALDLTYSLLVSAAKNNTLGTSAVSELFTQVESIDGDYVAESGFTSKVDEAIGSIIQQASSNSSLTTIVNQVGSNTSNISAITSRVGALEQGDFISETEMLNCLEDELDGTTVKSDVKSKVNRNAKTAAATLFATVANEDKSITAQSIASAISNDNAAVTTLASHFTQVDPIAVETIVENKLIATANVADWTAYSAMINDDHTAIGSLSTIVNNLPDGSNIVTTSMISSVTDSNGDITAASIIAKVNEAGSSVSISANCLNLSGNTWSIGYNGEGFLANHNLEWGANGGLNIKSDSLVMETIHPWWGSVETKGNGAICIVGDYTNTPVEVTYDSENLTYSEVYVSDMNGYVDDKKFTVDLATACPAAIFDGSGAGIALMNPNGHKANTFILANSGHGLQGVNDLNTFVQLQAVAWGNRLQSDAEYLGTPNNSSDGLAISNNVLVDGEIIANKGIFASSLHDNILGSTKIYGTAKIKGNIAASYKKAAEAGGAEVNLNGISKTIKIGNYYLTFAKGILIRCETTDPFSGNDPFIDTTEYANGVWDTNIIDTSATV